MRGIINNIINFYQMQAKALGVLVANTQKALEQSEKEKKADEQTKRVENFVKDLTMNLNNMLAKFYFLKERKSRKQEQLAEGQTRAVAEFAIFVKTLTRKVSSLLQRFEENQTFEEKIDKEIKELEADVSRRLKEFDKAIDETGGVLNARLLKFLRNLTRSFAKLGWTQRIFLPRADSKEAGNPLGKSTQNTEEDSLNQLRNSGDNQLENLVNYSSIKSVKSDEIRSKSMMQLKA